MKAIKNWSRTIDTTKDGRKCTPFEMAIYFHGNILFAKGFAKKWFNYTGACLHLLGFRFTRS